MRKGCQDFRFTVCEEICRDWKVKSAKCKLREKRGRSRTFQLNRGFRGLRAKRLGARSMTRGGACFEGVANRGFGVGNAVQETPQHPIEGGEPLSDPDRHGLGFGAEGSFRFEGGSAEGKTFTAPRDGVTHGGVEQAQVKGQTGGGRRAI